MKSLLFVCRYVGGAENEIPDNARPDFEGPNRRGGNARPDNGGPNLQGLTMKDLSMTHCARPRSHDCCGLNTRPQLATHSVYAGSV